jgi:phage gp46-like protein
MTDIALVENLETGKWDLSLAGADLATDDGLQTAVALSIICDAYAAPDDVIPDGSTDRRGYWGDAFSIIQGDNLGSKDWLLSREKQLPAVLAQAIQSAKDALQWMIDDGIAGSISVTGSWIQTGAFQRIITITKPDGSTFRYQDLWRAM